MTGVDKVSSETERIELRLLAEGVFAISGYDFRDYAGASMRRRVLACVQQEGASSITDLLARALHDSRCLDRLVCGLTVNFSAMFRDPTFFSALREQALPLLPRDAFLRLWVAGCATGEEVYSLAILLHEEGIYDRCRIYATDISEAVLAKAKAGIFPIARMRQYTENYFAAGGHCAFSDYYTADRDHVVFRRDLQRNVHFAAHNLATDASFNAFHLILCRNVMIYFNRDLQHRVHRLLLDSMEASGLLVLGRQESLRFSPAAPAFATVSERERIYRRVG